MADLMKFESKRIASIASPETGRIEFRDTVVVGLRLRVTASGIKTFSFYGRPAGSGKVERISIGRFPTVKPEEARQRARAIAGELAQGLSVAKASRARRDEPLLRDLFTDYRSSLETRGKGTENIDSLWRLYVAPAFGAKRLSEVNAIQLERWHRGLPAAIQAQREAVARKRYEVRKADYERRMAERQIRARGPIPKPPTPPKKSDGGPIGHRTANQALFLVRAMFNWALLPRIAKFSGVNPAAGHDVFAEVERERFLLPAELRPFFEALAGEPDTQARDYVLLALLTGARRQNVLEMAWADISLERAEWRVPGAQMKNGQPQTVTLTPEAVQILAERKESAKSIYVFPSPRDRDNHMSEPRRAWARVRETARVQDLHFHDLRRTLGSWQTRTGASLSIIGKSLNHKSHEATAIYARLDLDPVRQSVDRATSAMFEHGGIRPKAKVIPLPKRSDDSGADDSLTA